MRKPNHFYCALWISKSECWDLIILAWPQSCIIWLDFMMLWDSIRKPNRYTNALWILLNGSWVLTIPTRRSYWTTLQDSIKIWVRMRKLNHPSSALRKSEIRGRTRHDFWLIHAIMRVALFCRDKG